MNDTTQPSRRENARKYGKIGLIAGAVFGLLSSGGSGMFLAMLQGSLAAGAVGMFSGAVAGNALNGLTQRATSMFRRSGGAAALPEQVRSLMVDTPAPSVEDPAMNIHRDGHAQEISAEAARIAGLTGAMSGFDPNGPQEPVAGQGAHADHAQHRATHQGPQTLQ